MSTNREIKKEYKQTLPEMGIYCIKNLKSGKIFIGVSKELRGKLNSIRFQLNHGSFVNSGLQEEYKSSGENNFSFEILDTLEPKENPGYDYSRDLKELEKLWLEKLQPYDNKGYNKRTINK